MKILFKSFLAGIMIAIGGTVFLSIENKVIGASLFSIGLFGITNFNLKYIKELIITLIGNFIGACSVGFILRYTRIYDNIYKKSLILANTKLNDNILSIFILSIFCGLLMYYAVNGFKKQTDFGKYLVVYLGVAVFILCGFEHCIANMYYFSVADIWSLKTLGYTGIMVLGNSLGSFIIPLCNLVIKEN